MVAVSSFGETPISAPGCQLAASVLEASPAAPNMIVPVTPVGSEMTSTSLRVLALPSSSSAVRADIWAAIDNTVEFNLPPAPSLSLVSSKVPVKQNLELLRLMVSSNLRLTYKVLKVIVDKMTELLQVMGSPLKECS